MNKIPDEYYAELVDDFSRTLDLDACLADATQPGHYSAIAHDLAHMLDLDTGLEAILTPAKRSTSAAEVKTAAPARNFAADLALLLSSLGPQTRLRLRADPHYADLLRAVQLAAERIHAHAGDRDLARDLARDLVERDLEHVRICVSPFVQNLDLNLDLASASSLKPEDIGDLLMVLEKAAADFTGADLRAVSLVGVHLEGIRWSSATLWPPEWEEQIRAESIEIDDGIFIIRGKYQQEACIIA